MQTMSKLNAIIMWVAIAGLTVANYIKVSAPPTPPNPVVQEDVVVDPNEDSLIDGPPGDVDVGDPLILKIPKDVDNPIWLVYPELPIQTFEDGHVAVLPSQPQGTYLVVVSGVKAGRPVQMKRIVVIAEDGVEPTPVPVPPGPNPPGPTPPKPVDPIPVTGLRVLIIEETDDPEQRAEVGADMVAWLDENTVKSADGKKTGWRLWDMNLASTPEWSAFKAEWEKAKSAGAKGPYVIISNGKTGYSGVWPAEYSAQLELVNKYKG